MDSPPARVELERISNWSNHHTMYKTEVPITIHVRCIEDNKSYSIYKLDSSASLDEISAEIIQLLESHYGYMYRALHFDVYTDFDFTHNRYFNPKYL